MSVSHAALRRISVRGGRREQSCCSLDLKVDLSNDAERLRWIPPLIDRGHSKRVIDAVARIKRLLTFD